MFNDDFENKNHFRKIDMQSVFTPSSTDDSNTVWLQKIVIHIFYIV